MQAQFSVSQTGVLAFRPVPEGRLSTLTWLDRQGKPAGTVGGIADYSNPAFSPDEKRLAVCVRDLKTGKREIRIHDLVRSTTSRLTFDPSDNLNPYWSPDGTLIYFTSDRKGKRDIYFKSAAKTGEDQLLLEFSEAINVEHLSPDGKYLLFNTLRNPKPQELWLLPLGGSQRTPKLLLSGPYSVIQGQFSPDGKWIAYHSQESGSDEVFVQPFPPNGKKWQVSTAGGVEPQWRGDGKELFYYSGTEVMAVDVQTKGEDLEFGFPLKDH